MKQFTHILVICCAFFLFANMATAQSTITGIVTDASSGDPLIGASVLEKGTDNGVTTDINGKYSINVSEKAILIINYTGYTSQEVVVGAKTEMNIEMREGVTTDEMVVTGYESTKAKRKAGKEAKRLAKIKATKTITKEAERSISSEKESRRKAESAKVSADKIKASPPASPKPDVSVHPDDVYADGAIEAYSSEPVRSDVAVVAYSEESTSYSSKGSASEALATKTSSYDKDIKAGTLTAGEINDFSKWDLWEDIETTDLGGYQKTWNMSLVDRYTVQLMNKKGIPIIDAEVQVFNQDKEVLWTSRSDNTGKAELWLNIFKKENAEKLYAKVSYNGKTHKIKRINTFHNGINTLEIDEPCNLPNQVDVMFVVDATGSMSDEINYLKVELRDVIQSMQKKNEDLTINLGSVFYRDHGDAYLTKQSEFSDEIEQTIEFIGQQGAGGGGDTPEAVDDALEVAIDKMKWSENAITRLLFLVLDAPPHKNVEVLAKLERLTKKAAEKGIRIIPLTASGIDKSTEYLMRSMALSTNGTYVFLTDDSGVGGSHIKPTTDSYDVETLNELLVRLYVQYTQTPTCQDDQTFAMIDNNEEPTDEQANENPENPVEFFSFKYYPNPSRGQLTIELETELDECFITDASGKIIQRHTNLQAGQTPIDLSGFPSGIYFIRYMKGEKAETKKLILMK